MKRTSIVVLGCVVLASVATAAGFAAAQTGDEPSRNDETVTELTVSAQDTSSVASKTPALPENLERIVATEAAAAREFPLMVGDDGEELLRLSRDDFVRQWRAIVAQGAGLPFDSSELLAPLYNDQGVVAAYRAMNIKGRLTVDEATAPGFDLCARQAADTGKPATGCK